MVAPAVTHTPPQVKCPTVQQWHEGCGVTSHLLSSKAHPQEGIHSWYCKSDQRSMA